MTSQPSWIFGKGSLPRCPSAVVLACTAVSVMGILLLSVLPSPNRLPDAGHIQRRDRLRVWEVLSPAAVVQPQRDRAMGLSADREALTLYNDMVRFWGLDIEIGKVGQISFSEDFPVTAAHAELAQNRAAPSTGKDMSALRP